MTIYAKPHSKNMLYRWLVFSLVLTVLHTSYNSHDSGATSTPKASSSNVLVLKEPKINDPGLRTQVVYSGLKFPTGMAFLEHNDILVIEKNEGKVWRIIDGTMQSHPLLSVNVSNQAERGMLGIAVAKNITTNATYVFLYYTESQSKDGQDVSEGKKPLGNRLYRYELVGDKLINPKLLLDLPATPGPTHNGGKIAIGPDNNVYLVIGIVGRTGDAKTLTQNVKGGPEPDGRGGILRISQDGSVVNAKAVLGDTAPLNTYYAYGIRNGFGLAFDPITDNLWDTENGPADGDEINLVKPGFNSGWGKVQGMWERKIDSGSDSPGSFVTAPSNLVDFDGRGKYQSPKFVWNHTVGPTGIEFLNNDKLGKKFQNDLFVGDFHNGYLYDFDLDSKRQGLALSGPLHDKIANSASELQGIIFGFGFGGITDLAVGPDGYLYVLSLYQYDGGTNCDPVWGDPSLPCIQYSSPEEGSIFRIMPK